MRNFMHLRIHKEVFDNFDWPVIGVIYCYGIDNKENRTEVGMLLRDAETTARSEFSRFESLGEHPNIAAWRAAYKKFGADPHQYRCSVESLVRRVLKGESVPHVNKLVDLYNYISLKYVIPVGGENIDAIRGDLRLAFADGTEEFVRLNGAENEPPAKGEVIYKDDQGTICRRWNWREADRTKLTEDTKSAVVVLDALAPVDRVKVQKAATELAELVKRFCGGEIECAVLDCEIRKFRS